MSDSTNQTMGFKFGFKINASTKPKSVVQTNKLINIEEPTINNNVDYVLSIDDKKIKATGTSSLSKKEKDLVIPLIAVNKYNIVSKKKEVKNEEKSTNEQINNETETNDLTALAKQELIKEAKRYNDGDEADESVPAWKLMVINKVPEEYENDSKLDVSIRPDVSTSEDYETMPIEAFGTAMLRGMGWKDGDPIGGINKGITPIYEPQLRPRGLGLGADISMQKQLQNGKDNSWKSDNAPIRKGSLVCVEAGPCKGKYGTVESINEDVSHILVKLNLLKESIEFPHAVLRVVTKKEFDQEGRIINKTKFDDYKYNNNNRNDEASTSDSMKKKDNQYQSKNYSEIWIRPNIRAEIRDKKFKDGRYYKEKVVILSTDGDKCTCRTKNHKVLENVPQSILRTVMPRSNDDLVMIVRGPNRGQLASIEHLGRHDATVKLVGKIFKPLNLSLDDICEYYDR